MSQKRSASLSKKATKVVKFLADNGVASIREISRACFPGVRPVEKADSWARNALRIPTRDGYAKKQARGTYDATGKGRAVLTLTTPVEIVVETAARS